MVGVTTTNFVLVQAAEAVNVRLRAKLEATSTRIVRRVAHPPSLATFERANLTPLSVSGIEAYGVKFAASSTSHSASSADFVRSAPPWGCWRAVS